MVYTVLSSNSKKMPSKGLSEDEILNKSTACLCINDAQYVVYLTAFVVQLLSSSITDSIWVHYFWDEQVTLNVCTL